MIDPMFATRAIMEHASEPAEKLQAWATAALAEEMRTANLLALAELIEERYDGTLVLAYRHSVTAGSVVAHAARQMGLGRAADQDDEDEDA